LREGEEKEERRVEAVQSAVEEQVESEVGEDERVLTQGSHMGDEEMGGGRS
jgi:hypothetical protein